MRSPKLIPTRTECHRAPLQTLSSNSMRRQRPLELTCVTGIRCSATLDAVQRATSNSHNPTRTARGMARRCPWRRTRISMFKAKDKHTRLVKGRPSPSHSVVHLASDVVYAVLSSFVDCSRYAVHPLHMYIPSLSHRSPISWLIVLHCFALAVVTFSQAFMTLLYFIFIPVFS